MKKRLLSVFIVALLVLTTLLSGCSNNEATGNKETGSNETMDTANEGEFSGTLKVQMIGDFKMEDSTDPLSGEKSEGVHVLKEEFERRYPGVTLELIIMGWDSYQQKTQTMLTGNEADVYQMPGIASFAEQGLLEPLAPYIERDNFDLDIYIDGQVDGWTALGYGDSEMQIYGLPMLGDTRVIVYDKVLFDQWGVEYLSEEPTYEEILNAASTIYGENPVTGVQNFGFYTRGKYAFDQTVNIAEYLGGVWGEGYSLASMTTNFNSPEMVEALEKLMTLCGYSPQGMLTDQGNELFGTANNNIAMTWSIGPGYLKNLEALDLVDRYGVAMMFVNPDEGKGGVFAGSPVGISKSSENKDLAWEYVKFTGSEFFQSYIWEQHGGVPTLNEAFEWDSIKDNEHVQVLLKSMGRLWTPRYVYRSGTPRSVLGSYVEKALLGEMGAKEALDGAQKDVMDWVATQS